MEISNKIERAVEEATKKFWEVVPEICAIGSTNESVIIILEKKTNFTFPNKICGVPVETVVTGRITPLMLEKNI